MRRRRLVRVPSAAGERVVIKKDGQAAERGQAGDHYNGGTVMLDRPFGLDEALRVGFVVTGVRPKWAGNVCVRFVREPAAVKDLPLTARYDPTHELALGDRIECHMNRTGTITYYRNGALLGHTVFDKKHPNEPADVLLYCVIDLYAQTAAIELAEPVLWSPQTHSAFPPQFRAIVCAILLCHRRQDGNLMSTLPKFVLFDVFVALGELYGAFRFPPPSLSSK
jgi:hypothetical protein